ncbi:TetR-like C-terminal domain-containing protein [Paracoccus sp. J39]
MAFSFFFSGPRRPYSAASSEKDGGAPAHALDAKPKLQAETPVLCLPRTGDSDAVRAGFSQAGQGRVGRVIAELLGRAQSDEALMAAFHRGFLVPRRNHARELIARGRADGVFRADLDLDLIIDLYAGPIYFRAFAKHAPLDRDFAEGLARLVGAGGQAAAAGQDGRDPGRAARPPGTQIAHPGAGRAAASRSSGPHGPFTQLSARTAAGWPIMEGRPSRRAAVPTSIRNRGPTCISNPASFPRSCSPRRWRSAAHPCLRITAGHGPRASRPRSREPSRASR